MLTLARRKKWRKDFEIQGGKMAKNLLENPLSNSQISKSQSILNRAYSEKVASLNRILWLIEPYPYHPRNFDY